MIKVDLKNVINPPIATNASINAIESMIVQPDGKLRFVIDTGRYVDKVDTVARYKEYKFKKYNYKDKVAIYEFGNDSEWYEVIFADVNPPFQLKHYKKTGIIGIRKTEEIYDTKDKKRNNEPSEDDFQSGKVKSLLVFDSGNLQFIYNTELMGGERKVRKNGLEARTVAELKERCAKRGIKVHAGMKKADLVAALRRR